MLSGGTMVAARLGHGSHGAGAPSSRAREEQVATSKRSGEDGEELKHSRWKGPGTLGRAAARLGAGSCMVATSGARVAQRGNPPNRSWAQSSASWRPFLDRLWAEFGHGSKGKVEARMMLYDFLLGAKVTSVPNWEIIKPKVDSVNNLIGLS
jgi:hypothetical protein